MLNKNIKEVWLKEISLKYKIKLIMWEFKKALQRFYRGYDDELVWNMRDNLLELIKNILIDLRNNHEGYPFIEGEIESDEEYTHMISKMIMYIAYIQYYEDIGQNEEKRIEYQSKFFHLFAKYYDLLWD